VVVAHQSKPLPVLRFTKLGKVFTYGNVAMRRSRPALLGMAVAASDGEATRRKLDVDGGGLRGSSG
jgi:hypothetical protein